MCNIIWCFNYKGAYDGTLKEYDCVFKRENDQTYPTT